MAGEPKTVEALGRELYRVAQRVDRVERVAAQTVEQLVRPAGRVGDADEEPPADEWRSWFHLGDRVAAGEDLDDLLGWLRAVYLRYDRAELSTCWAWHPGVVEELRVVRDAHREAIAAVAESGVRALGDWHERSRPGVVKRVSAALDGCDLTRHAAGHNRAPRPITVPLADHLDDLTSTWTTTRTTPHPTADQLHQADQHHRAARVRDHR